MWASVPGHVWLDLLMPHGQHLLHGCDSCPGEALAVLAHLDGLQPFRHRPEHGAVAAAGARQSDGDTAGGTADVRIGHYFTFT